MSDIALLTTTPLPSKYKKQTYRSMWMMVVILLLALALRSVVAVSGLPFVENVDEPNMYRLANDRLGRIPFPYLEEWLTGYPPAYIWTAVGIMWVTDRTGTLDINTQMGVYVGILRLVNVLADLVTLSLLVIVTRWLGGWYAGLLAGTLWAISAPVAANTGLALPDCLAALFGMLCIALSIRGILLANPWFGLPSVISGLLSVYFKYPWAPVLLLPMLMYLLIFIKAPVKRNIWLPAVLSGLSGVIGIAWLLFGYGALTLHNTEAAQVKTSFFANLTSGLRWQVTLVEFAKTSSIGLIALGFVAAIILFVTSVRQRPIRLSQRRVITLSLFLLMITLFVPIPVYLKEFALTPANVSDGDRYVLPPSLLLISLGAVLIAYGARINRFKRIRWFIWLIPCLALTPAAVMQVLDRVRPTTYTQAQYWFERNVPDHSTYWTNDYYAFRLLDRYNSGFSGLKEFTTTPDSAAANYIIVLDEAITKSPWKLDQITLLKKFDNQTKHGPTLSVYIPYRLPQTLNTTFFDGKLSLVLQGAQIQIHGQSLSIGSLWQAPYSSPLQDYSFFIRLTAPESPTVLLDQEDGSLGVRPTSTWDDPTELVPGNIQTVHLPILPPGNYVVTIGIYDGQSGRRLQTPDGMTVYQMLSFSVF